MHTNPTKLGLAKKFIIKHNLEIPVHEFLTLEDDLSSKWSQYSRPALIKYALAIASDMSYSITTAILHFHSKLMLLDSYKPSRTADILHVFGESSSVYKNKLAINKNFASCNFEKFALAYDNVDDARAAFNLKYGSNSINSIMARHGVDEEEAKRIVNKRSDRGLATFNSKSIEERTRINGTKGLNLNVYIEKYGPELGQIKYDKQLQKRYGFGSRDWYIAKYGIVEGTELYVARCAPEKYYTRPEWWAKKYGLSVDEAAAMCKSHLSARPSFSKQYCINKYGGTVGHAVWQDRQILWQQTMQAKSKEELLRINNAKSVTLETYKKKYGAELGEQKYVEMITKRWERIQLSFSSGTSKAANKFFASLLKSLIRAGFKLNRKDLYVGLRGSKEFFLTSNGRVKFYDFTLRSICVIIEFNGSFWHPRTKDTWGRTDVSFEDAITREVEKRDLALKNGFDVFYVWDDDDLPEKIKELTNMILQREKR